MAAASQRAIADESFRDLKALEAIEQNPSISQRELARSMGVALGVANACMRTLARKGLVKIRGESNRSITYHITKQGRVHKARLAVEWTGNTIGFYVQARATVAALLDELVARGVDRVVVLGADEAAELVVLLAQNVGVEIVAIVEMRGRRIADSILGHQVVTFDALEPAETMTVIACDVPDETESRAVRAAFPTAEVIMLNGQTFEESIV